MDPGMLFFRAIEDLVQLLEQYWDNIKIVSSGIWVNRGWNSPEGNISAFEISFFAEGRAVLNLNNRKYKASPGNLYFSDLSMQCSCNDSNFKLYYITFIAANAEIYRKLKTIFKDLFECIQSENAKGLEEYFINFHYENSLPGLLNRLSAKHCFTGMLIKFYRSFNTSSKVGLNRLYNPEYDKRVTCVIKYLNENYQKNIELKQISEIFTLNPRYLDNIFKSITGTTIIKYLIKLRIEKAKRLLSFTSMGITNVAIGTGFCDCQHFCKTFKRIESLTPNEFRQKTGGLFNT